MIPPKTLVTIAAGMPHTWTACPAGVDPLGTKSGSCVSDGKSLMIYEYEEPTGFFPTKQTETLREVGEYVRCPEAELDGIRIRELSKEEVLRDASFVWERKLKKGGS